MSRMEFESGGAEEENATEVEIEAESSPVGLLPLSVSFPNIALCALEDGLRRCGEEEVRQLWRERKEPGGWN